MLIFEGCTSFSETSAKKHVDIMNYMYISVDHYDFQT